MIVDCHDAWLACLHVGLIIFGPRAVIHNRVQCPYDRCADPLYMSVDDDIFSFIKNIVIDTVQECIRIDVWIGEEIFILKMCYFCTAIAVVGAGLLTVLGSFLLSCFRIRFEVCDALLDFQ